MSRGPSNSLRGLVTVTAIVTVLAFLPTRWLAPWTNDVAAVVNLPLAPLGDAATRLRLWLRPPGDPLRGMSDAEAALVEERDRYRSLWHAERLRAEQLEELLADYRLTAGLHRGTAFTPVMADVIGRSPGGTTGPVRLNVGSRHGVEPGDVAVFRGSHLVGRVASDVGSLSSWLVPTTDPASGRLQCVVVPVDGSPPDDTRRILATPEGDGTFVADADASWGVAPGAEVVLDDPAWPTGGRGMTLGFVESALRRDDQPLRQRLVIRPRYDAQRLASVVVKTEGAPDGGTGGGAGGGAP